MEEAIKTPGINKKKDKSRHQSRRRLYKYTSAITPSKKDKSKTSTTRPLDEDEWENVADLTKKITPTKKGYKSEIMDGELLDILYYTMEMCSIVFVTKIQRRKLTSTKHLSFSILWPASTMNMLMC